MAYSLQITQRCRTHWHTTKLEGLYIPFKNMTNETDATKETKETNATNETNMTDETNATNVTNETNETNVACATSVQITMCSNDHQNPVIIR